MYNGIHNRSENMSYPEIWKDVKGYEGIYKISSYGSLISVGRWIDRGLRGKAFHKEKIMSESINGWGYIASGLRKDGNTVAMKRHRLVAFHFIGSPIGLRDEVNHINGIKTDNRVGNLEWVTRQENMHHASISGLMEKSCKQIIVIPQSLLEVIQSECSTGNADYRRIAAKYNVTQRDVHLIAIDKYQ